MVGDTYKAYAVGVGRAALYGWCVIQSTPCAMGHLAPDCILRLRRKSATVGAGEVAPRRCGSYACDYDKISAFVIRLLLAFASVFRLAEVCAAPTGGPSNPA